MPSSQSRIYRVRRPWKGEQADVERIGTDAHAEFKDIERSITAIDDGLRAIEARAEPEQRRSRVSFKYATDNQSVTGAGTTQATAKEVPGQGGAATLRPTFTTDDDINSSFILLEGKFTAKNVSGTSRQMVTIMQYGIGAAPSTWTRMQQYRLNLNSEISNGDARGIWPWYLFGSQEGPASERLQPNTTYTFRLLVATAGGPTTSDWDFIDATELGKRVFCGILHPF